MKKLKIAVVILIQIFLMIYLMKNVDAKTYTADEIASGFGFNSLNNADNVYCLEHSRGIVDPNTMKNKEWTYTTSSTISVNGNTGAVSVNGNERNNLSNEALSSYYNLAATVAGAAGPPGYGVYKEETDSQYGTWAYVNEVAQADPSSGLTVDPKNSYATSESKLNEIKNTVASQVKANFLGDTTVNMTIMTATDTNGAYIQTLLVYNTETITITDEITVTEPDDPSPTTPPPDEKKYCHVKGPEKVIYSAYLRSITEEGHVHPTESRTKYTAAEGKDDTSGKVTISGTVWKEELGKKSNVYNRVFDKTTTDVNKEEEGVENIKVIWKTESGEILAEGYTDENGYYKLTTSLTYKNHSYELPLEEFEKITNSYVEFEYNGLKYTTTGYEQGGASENTSKAEEDVVSRNILDQKFDNVTSSESIPTSVKVEDKVGDSKVAEYILGYDENGKVILDNNISQIYIDGEQIQRNYDKYNNLYLNGKLARIVDEDDDNLYIQYGEIQFLEINGENAIRLSNVTEDEVGNTYVNGEIVMIWTNEDGVEFAFPAKKDANGNIIINYGDVIAIPKTKNADFTVKASTKNILTNLVGDINDYITEPGAESEGLYKDDELTTHSDSGYQYHLANLSDVCVWHCDEEHLYKHTREGHQNNCVAPYTCHYIKVYHYWHHWEEYTTYYTPSCWNCNLKWEPGWRDSDGEWHEGYWYNDCDCGYHDENGCCGCHTGNTVLTGSGEEADHDERYDAYHVVDGPCDGDCCLDIRKRVTGWEITNVNLGLIEKEQPDLALSSDIDHVRVIMNKQEYTYVYNYRSQIAEEKNVNVYDYQVVFQDKTLTAYRRPVNPADISYNDNIPDSEEKPLQVYVTYKISAKNFSNTLIADVNKIVNYYDSDYTLYPGTTNWKTSDEIVENEFKAAYLDWNVELKPQSSATTYVEYRVNNDAIQLLMGNKSVPLNNVSEIYSYTTRYGSNTICAELEEAKRKNPNRTGSLYSGVDRDSIVGNIYSRGLLNRIGPVTSEGTMSGVSKDEFEDDEDCAPTFYLEKDEYKVISGTIYEDKTSYDNEKGRLGSGQKEDDEQGIENVKVELLLVDDKGQVIIKDGKEKVAELYYIDDDGKSAAKPAVTYTDKDGNYSFGSNDPENGTLGVVVDYYVIKYTYGNDTSELNKATTINGEEINARNYKSTIITDGTVSQAMNKQNDDKWHLKTSDNYSVAVDDLNERLSIEDMYNGNYKDSQNMVAYSMPFKTQVEYTEKQENKSLQDGNAYISDDNEKKNFEFEWTVFDFGIAERAKEDLQLDKTISYVRITLANGQILLAGDPRKEDISYVKTMGIKNSSSSAYGRELSAEIDSELIQGATLEIQYAITLTNNSEKDYEFEYQYGANIQEGDKESISGNELYPDITGGEGVPTIEDITIIKDPTGKYITTYSEANYYYYGVINENHPLIKSTVDWVVDYLDPQLTCTVGKEAENDKGDIQVNSKTYKDKYGNENAYIWEKVEPLAGETTEDGNTIKTIKTAAAKLANEKLISSTVKDALGGESKENYLILKTNAFWDVEAGNSKTIYLYASKLLGSQSDDYVYDNHAEIVQIESKIARTKGYMNKSYTPGEYIPQFGRVQQDDDMVRVVITPPTGTTTNINIYAIVGAISLIVIAGGVIFIKKKVIG